MSILSDLKRIIRIGLDAKVWLLPNLAFVTNSIINPGRNKKAEFNDNEHLSAAIKWLETAQDATTDGGVAGRYSLSSGWSSSYPETTGYIIPTLLRLEEVFEKAAAEDHEYMVRTSDALKLQRGLLFFLAETSLQPVFEAYADKLKGYVDQERWWRGYCPICGSKPVMAELIGRERKKFLICSCCGYEWRFMRTKCPYCENEERRAFKYFFAEKEGRAYRVETCQKCKKYIKTVDTEELDEEVIPSVEDVGTLYLDVLAQKEGYTREVHPLGLNLANWQDV